ncbi:hypothetical protein J2W35_006454 [Variovorax boronicumulans]|uniref:hypothetical protein n=1 Tax=Variovorax boronicumulans TaxID=436515 RepID=UPI00277E6C8D|nr:hypothetical protein [Variovorax boronicumulans]MDQ0086073.1 hypothetical protein [Variovorax boronicumulans]
MNLAKSSIIAQQAGGSIQETMKMLCNLGYVREHTGRQSDGLPAHLYSLTSVGKAALETLDDETAAANLIPGVAAPRVCAPSSALYDGSEMRPYVGRPGALNAFKFPSRVGQRLYHPDGTVTPLE